MSENTDGFAKHPAAIAWDKYRERVSKDGHMNSDTLGTTSPNTYLENRISRAFQAGWDAREMHDLMLRGEEPSNA